jgi:hypothetical protein
MARSVASRTWVVSIVAIAALMVITLGGCSNGGHSTAGASQSPASQSSSPPSQSTSLHMTKTHVSHRLHYQMSYPSGWTLKSATQTSVHGQQGGGRGDPTVDEYDSPGPAAVVVSSEKLPAGMTGQQWLRAYATGGPPTACWPPAAQWGKLKIAGHTARLHGGLVWCNFIEAVTVADGRGYVFTGSPSTHCCHTFSQDTLMAFLATVRFPGDGTA